MRSLRGVVVVVGWLCGCDCAPSGSCREQTDCTAAQACVDGRCVPRPDVFGDAGATGLDATGRDALGQDGGFFCRSAADCEGGTCLPDGSCCGDAADVCGSACCDGAGEVCFANACVVPGAPCHTTDECPAGQYCEPGLGATGPDAGGDAGVCSSASRAGRCVPLPPDCDEAPAGTTCITSCEVRPTPGRPLDAIQEWRWGPGTPTRPDAIDVWSTPAVGRLADTSCDGRLDELDSPTIVFVSGDVMGLNCGNASTPATERSCKTGVLRALDGRTGREVWSLQRPAEGSLGFSGVSVAIGDLDHDRDMEIVTVSGEGRLVIVDHQGRVVATATEPLAANWLTAGGAGWGGGLSLADADHDGEVEIAFGRVVYSTNGTRLTRRFAGTAAWGGGLNSALSAWVNLDADSDLELLAGATAYDVDGRILWTRGDIPAGFSAPANFDSDPAPEVVVVAEGRIYLLDGTNGADVTPSVPAMGSSPGNGGPPTIADFDADGAPEVGVAWRQFYEVFELAGGALRSLWATQNHDLSSSVTGSTVFDFEGDGEAEVVYNDECFTYVYAGRTGRVRFATQTSSFTATESALVADVDGDGGAELLVIGNSADPTRWGCTNASVRAPAPRGASDFGRPGWVGSDGDAAPYRGIAVFGARDGSWVGTRTLWNQHAYSVTNVCGDRGDPCGAGASYGDIPRNQVANWSLGHLNNFRQNIQGEGIFDAPDAVVTLRADCTSPIRLTAAVQNIGARVLPAGVTVTFVRVDGATETELGRGATAARLFPGQAAVITFDAPVEVPRTATFRARITRDATTAYRECREDNNESPLAAPVCVG